MNIMKASKLLSTKLNNLNYVRSMSGICKNQAVKEKKDKKADCKSQVVPLNEKATKPATHVIINFDGIIVDSNKLDLEAHENYLMKWKKALKKDLRNTVLGQRNEEAGDAISYDLMLPVDGKVYANGIWQYQMNSYRGPIRRIKNTEDFVCYFKRFHIPVALISHSTKKGYNFKIRDKKIRDIVDMFCHVVLGDDEEVLKGKPEPDLFDVAASRFTIKPKEKEKVVVFESTISGVLAAKKAGMQVVLLPDPLLSGEWIQKSKPDIILNTFENFDPSDFEFPIPAKKKF